eukprot:2388935-Karenia_brevis.AAC.1
MRPARIVHRVHQYLQDVEISRGDQARKIEKHMNGKFVTANGDRVCYTFRGEQRWTAKGVSFYSDEEREIGGACAEND